MSQIKICFLIPSVASGGIEMYLLESNEDLSRLLEILNSVKGADNKPAIMTINNIVSNPDFEKIKESGFKKYFNEPFIETLKKYPKHDKVMTLYREGIHNKLILPQFHGKGTFKCLFMVKGFKKK